MDECCVTCYFGETHSIPVAQPSHVLTHSLILLFALYAPRDFVGMISGFYRFNRVISAVLHEN